MKCITLWQPWATLGSLSSFLVSVPRGSAGWDDPNAPKRPG